MNAPLPPVSSPCVRICRIDPQARICEGCGRSLDEIASWVAIGEVRRRAVMAELPGRLARLAER